MLTSTQKQLFKHLLNGCYLVKQSSLNKRYTYKLFEGVANPKMFVRDKLMNGNFKALLKKDSKGRYTLNLNVVRQMNGNTWVKKEYKN